MKKDIKLVFEDSRIIETNRGITVREILKIIDDDKVIALRVNGSAVPADYEIMEDSFVNYITTVDRIGQKIYTKGLEYIYIKAVREVFGSKAVVNIKHSLDKSLYTEITGKREINANHIPLIKKAMKEIVDKDMPFKHISVSRSDAYDYVTSLNEPEKALNYLYMTNDSVTMYELDDDYNYFYYLMPPSTGYLKRFDLTYVEPNGIVLSYPIKNIIPKYNPSPKVLEAFKDYEKELAGLGVRYAGEVNKMIVEGKINDFIQANEILYDKNLEEVAIKVAKNKSIRAIFISGPSSSGKTTSSKKLALYLRSRGIEPFVISTDDYFVEREDSPRKADGSYEFEIVEALDIKLFNSQLKYYLHIIS